jgi:hypothetical protein
MLSPGLLVSGRSVSMVAVLGENDKQGVAGKSVACTIEPYDGRKHKKPKYRTKRQYGQEMVFDER